MYTSKLNTVTFDNFEIVKNDDLRERAGRDAFSDDMLAMGGYGIAAMSTVACPPACALAVAAMGVQAAKGIYDLYQSYWGKSIKMKDDRKQNKWSPIILLLTMSLLSLYAFWSTMKLFAIIVAGFFTVSAIVLFFRKK